MLLLDTCALIWFANRDPIAPPALKAITKAVAAGELFLSPISAWEIGALASRGRLALAAPAEAYVRTIFTRDGVQTAPLTAEIGVRASYLPGQFHADPADRLLVATALAYGLKLITRDRNILDYAAQGYVPALAC